MLDLYELAEQDWNFSDASIYEHFNKTFWRKIERYPQFFDDLKKLETRLNEIEENCLIRNEGKRVKTNFNEVEMKGYQLSKQGEHNETCQLMILPELELQAFYLFGALAVVFLGAGRIALTRN